MSIVYVHKQIGEVSIDPKISLRGIDADHVQDLMHAQLEYGESEWQDRWHGSLIITEDGHVVDGHHTLEAAMENFGKDHVVRFQVQGKTFRDAFFLATGTNASHGKRRTNEEKRSAVLRWLEDDKAKQWTDSYIAKQCNVSHSTVLRISEHLVQSTSYTRPTRRKYRNGSGEEVWIETAEIGNGSDPSPQEELPGVPTTQEISDKEKRKGWVDLSLKIAHSIMGLELNNLIQTYCIRRLKAPREVRTWEDADYAKGVDDAKSWLSEFDKPTPDGEMALMLEEIGLINEVLGTYKSLMGDQFHVEMLSTEGKDAKKAVMSLRTADFEAMDRSLRMELLGDLKNEFGYVSEFEEKARAEKEKRTEAEKAEKLLDAARTDAEAARNALLDAFEESGLSKHIDLETFAKEAAKAFDCYDSKKNVYGTGNHYILGDDYIRSQKLSLKEAEQWKSRFALMQVAVEEELAWVKALLYPQPQLDELKAVLIDKHWRRNFNWDTLTPADMNALAEKYNCTVAHVREAKKEVARENPPPDWEGLEVAIWDAEKSSGTYDLFKLAKKHHMGALESVAVMELQKKIVAELDEEPDYEQTHSEHTQRLKALPGEIRDYIPKWIRANPIRESELGEHEGEITLKLLLNARCQIEHGKERGPDPFFKEEMEDLLGRMKSNDAALIAKVKEFLQSDSEVTSVTEEQSPSNYSLEYLIVAFKDADHKIQPSLSFRVIPSRQMGEHPMTEVPDALKADLLKLIESKKVFVDEENQDV